MATDCDFCGENVRTNTGGWIYPCEDFTDAGKSIGFNGAWLACATCAAFIRQYDAGETRAKRNLASRAIQKYRMKYGVPQMNDRDLAAILSSEVGSLHDKFWQHRIEQPRPYTEQYLED